MKKLTILFLLYILLFSTSCSKTTTTDLTKDNYSDFIVIEYTLENCSVANNTYYGKTYYYTIGVSSKPKKRADYNDVVIKFWLNGNKYGTLTLDVNGEGKTSFNDSSTLGYPNLNRISFRVEKVAGTVSY